MSPFLVTLLAVGLVMILFGLFGFLVYSLIKNKDKE